MLRALQKHGTERRKDPALLEWPGDKKVVKRKGPDFACECALGGQRLFLRLFVVPVRLFEVERRSWILVCEGQALDRFRFQLCLSYFDSCQLTLCHIRKIRVTGPASDLFWAPQSSFICLAYDLRENPLAFPAFVRLKCRWFRLTIGGYLSRLVLQ